MLSYTINYMLSCQDIHNQKELWFLFEQNETQSTLKI